jgi:hypothetical protein
MNNAALVEGYRQGKTKAPASLFTTNLTRPVIDTGALVVTGWQINAKAMARPWPWEAGVLKNNKFLKYRRHIYKISETYF